MRSSTFGKSPIYLTVRQYLCDYLIQNRDRFRELIENCVEIDEYISKMLFECEWGVYRKLIVFSEFYDVQN